MGKINKKYNPEIDFWRLFFALCIFAFHSHKLVPNDQYSMMPFGFIATEFFFMVSGYFMAARIRSDKQMGLNHSTGEFLLGKIKTFYKPLVISVIIGFVVTQVTNRNGPVLLYKDALKTVYEFFLMCGYGFKSAHFVNGPAWYLSAMLIAMAILFPIAKKYTEYFFTVCAPIVALIIYALLSQVTGTLCTATDLVVFVSSGILRGVAGVSAGIFLNECCARWQKTELKPTPFGKFVASMIEIGLFFTLLILFRIFPQIELGKGFHYIAVIVMFLFLLIVFSGVTGLQEKIRHWNLRPLSQISLYLYFNHRFWIPHLNDHYPQLGYWSKTMWMAVGTIASMILCRLLVFLWDTVQKRYGQKIRSLFFRKETESPEQAETPEPVLTTANK